MLGRELPNRATMGGSDEPPAVETVRGRDAGLSLRVLVNHSQATQVAFCGVQSESSKPALDRLDVEAQRPRCRTRAPERGPQASAFSKRHRALAERDVDRPG